MRKNIIIAAAFCLTAASQAVAQSTLTATISISYGTKYQYIDGFGGTGMNGQWADVYNASRVRALWGTGTNQVGLNIMRIRINPNESNWGEYKDPVRWARATRKNSQFPLQVFATPWTPPKKYKTSKSQIYQNEYGTNVWPLVEHSWGGQGSNGGAINPEYYDEYADFLMRYSQKMEDVGAPIDIISIQNESDYTPTATDNGVEHASYESCIYSPKEMAAMTKALKDTLTAVGSEVKVMGPECFGWGEHNYNNTLVNISDAKNSIDIWGNHLYGANDLSYISGIRQKTGKNMWMTEYLIDYRNKDYNNLSTDYIVFDDQNPYTGQFAAEYKMIKSLEDALAAGFSAYVYYGMTNDFFATSYNGNQSTSTLNKRAQVFGHYTRFATGKTRVKSTLTDNKKHLIGGSAYVNEGKDTVSVFVLNTSATDTYSLVISLPWVPGEGLQMMTSDDIKNDAGRVTETRNRVVTDLTEGLSSTRRQTVTLEPGSFYTFQFVKLDTTDIDEAEADPQDDAPEALFDLSGRPLTTQQKGVNIVRQKDGTARKVIR